jgi:hypothetical protein
MKDDDSPTTNKNMKKKEKEKKIEVKKKMTLTLKPTEIQMNSNTTNNSTTDTTTNTTNNNNNIESHNKDKNHINTNINTNTKKKMNKKKMKDEKDKNKTNRMKDEKDQTDCTKKMNIFQIHHTRWWSHLDQHHHHYLLLLSCLEHLFVSLSLFQQRTLIILISFTFISTLAYSASYFSLAKIIGHEASVGTKVKCMDTNSVSDTSNDGNNCLNKKMKKTMNVKENEPTVLRELKNKSVVVDNWSLLCCCLTQVIQILVVGHLTLWSAWLTYTVDSRWWPLVSFSVSIYYPRLSHNLRNLEKITLPEFFLESFFLYVSGTDYWYM